MPASATGSLVAEATGCPELKPARTRFPRQRHRADLRRTVLGQIRCGHLTLVLTGRRKTAPSAYRPNRLEYSVPGREGIPA